MLTHIKKRMERIIRIISQRKIIRAFRKRNNNNKNHPEDGGETSKQPKKKNKKIKNKIKNIFPLFFAGEETQRAERIL